MTESPYSRFERETLILRDELAVDRTVLANERTLLAYLRSAVSLVIAGVTIVHFAVVDWFAIVGIMCVPLGIFAGIVGIVRYRKMANSVRQLRRRTSSLTTTTLNSAGPSTVNLTSRDDAG